MSCGSQPTSSSAPVQARKSACRTFAIRLGLASIWCTSCSALVPTLTSTSGPPSSVAIAPHSGSQAKTSTFAKAGVDAAHSSRRERICFFMFVFLWESEFVRAMGAEGCLVLQRHGRIGVFFVGVFAAELQAQQAELAVAPGQLHAVLGRIEI